MFKKNKINFCSSFIIYKFYFVYFILQIFIELLYMNNEDSIFLNFWSRECRLIFQLASETNKKKKIDTSGQGLINWINFSRR